MLKDEFKGEHGEARAMENSVIRTSLKSIKGKDKKAITNLFLAFALMPEDTPCRLDIMEMIYVSTIQNGVGQADVKPPNRFQIRKWLKVLINRSLVLGSVDRPQLHDGLLGFTFFLVGRPKVIERLVVLRFLFQQEREILNSVLIILLLQMNDADLEAAFQILAIAMQELPKLLQRLIEFSLTHIEITKTVVSLDTAAVK